MKPFNEKDAETHKVELVHNLPEGVELTLRNIRIRCRRSDDKVIDRTVDVDVDDVAHTFPLEEDYTFKVQYKGKSYTVALMLSDEEADNEAIKLDSIKIVEGNPEATLDSIVEFIVKTVKSGGGRTLPPPGELLRCVLGAANVTDELEDKFKDKLFNAIVPDWLSEVADDEDDEDDEDVHDPFSDISKPLEALRKLYGQANVDCLYKRALRLSKILSLTFNSTDTYVLQPSVTPLAKGTTYYTPGGASDELAIVERKWEDSPIDYRRLVFGQVFESKSDAATAAMLMTTPTCLALYDRAVVLADKK